MTEKPDKHFFFGGLSRSGPHHAHPPHDDRQAIYAINSSATYLPS